MRNREMGKKMDTIVLAESGSIFAYYANTPALKKWILSTRRYLSNIALIRIYKKHTVGITLLIHMYERAYNHEKHQIESAEIIYYMDIHVDGSLRDVHAMHQDSKEEYDKTTRPDSSREFDLAQEQKGL